MGLRTQLATGSGRLVRWGLRSVAHRAGSQLPGRLAVSLDPHVIGELSSGILQGSVVVCGTNGKTTTNNVLAAAMEASGRSVACNRDGANMVPGVAGALLDGAVDMAAIEADELSTIHILPELKPRYLVLLNLFRDQLDRAGEIDHVQDTIVAALAASPQTVLVTCGDDPLCMGVAYRAAEAGTKVIAFGIAEDLHLPADRVPEARFCQRCGAELTYEYRQYAQLGAFSCPACDFARPRLDYAATEVTVGREGVAFDVSGPGLPAPLRVTADFGGVYMVYNLLAALVAAHLMGVAPDAFQRALDGYHPANGRLQRFRVDGREVVLNLAKNPTGFNQNISLLLADDRPKAAFFVVNDHDNDGNDISWIWDVDFERFAAEPDLMVIAGGIRANDVQVRMKYAGITAPLAGSVADALAMVADLPRDRPLYVLTNYSALWSAKAELERMGERL
ncbi:MAG: MurT ligase domain-containing protein [Atopobiaceae bacterium]|jgi:UDP-N-acetylmuramyl tripeptide synthase|nr:MurT ligase domain-containing protein [Atopobiaceae bacterium]MCH4181199.1 MurT ligase domain-containing protein [Atopobiaceae bacterium]MCH4214964.1 MurT ligase domain-containing protein [Atopobiaceae bacterium]MDD2589007.1 MurT ligase domain-containing protein [Atopobiaceae bacterium]MDD3177714.1 MurT ligase domain-containing protein [Atopobiaceae bacterium]